jgi:succinylglutamic semialdehyde dehydrogenase
VHEAIADRFIAALCKAAAALTIGDPRSDPPVFMGPIISESSRAAVLDFQSKAAAAGAEVVLKSESGRPGLGFDASGYYLTPGILRVRRFVADNESTDSTGHNFHAGAHPEPGGDLEVFGPLLRIAVVPSLDEALAQANSTRFGLAASIFTKDAAAIDRFLTEARAGCINVNTGTAGASSKLPFGGLGRSGNHRPAGSFSLDYCAYPVAGMIESGDAAQITPGMRFDDGWIR